MTNDISTDCQGRTGKSETNSTIPAGDNQHPGQGAGAVEKGIHILDSCSAYRWEGGRQGSMGRDTHQPSPRSVGEGAPEDEWRGLDDSRLFFMDTRQTANYWDYWIHPGAILYHRLDERPLGEPERAKGGTGLNPSPRASGPRCFNCGSTEHLLSSCPDPRNNALIDMSRQLFMFFSDGSSRPQRRIHEFEEWKSRRLEWTQIYKPGEITGSLLREALESRSYARDTLSMPWLENISLWGYPPGWISCQDPVERVRRRILDMECSGSGGEELDDDPYSFVVLNDTPEDSETLQLGSSFASVPSDSPSEIRAPRRWVTYPNDYFLSELLPVYTGRVLPLTQSIELDGQPKAFSPPPPPSDPPPPLPPSFPHDDSFDDEVDMDLSD